MRIERALDERRRLAERIRAAYHTASLCKLTSEELNDMVLKAFAGLAKGAPEWVRSYGEGYGKSLNDLMYHNELVFGGYVGDVFMSTHSNRPDYYQKLGVEPSAYADNGAVQRRGHYWASDTSKPFFIS